MKYLCEHFEFCLKEKDIDCEELYPHDKEKCCEGGHCSDSPTKKAKCGEIHLKFEEK